MFNFIKSDVVNAVRPFSINGGAMLGARITSRSELCPRQDWEARWNVGILAKPLDGVTLRERHLQPRSLVTDSMAASL